MAENKSFTDNLPTWALMIATVAGVLASTVSWSYSTFVTHREADMIKITSEERQKSIEAKLDKMDAKIDGLNSLIKQER